MQGYAEMASALWRGDVVAANALLEILGEPTVGQEVAFSYLIHHPDIVFSVFLLIMLGNITIVLQFTTPLQDTDLDEGLQQLGALFAKDPYKLMDLPRDCWDEEVLCPPSHLSRLMPT